MTLQRRTPLRSKTPLKRGSERMKRNRIKQSEPRRDWSAARAKVDAEGCCRVCGSTEDLQAAHTIGRAKQDVEVSGPRGGKVLKVLADATVPLCGEHHRLFDSRRLDLLPYLKLPEQLNAVEAAGGIYAANRRLSGGC
jgi:hypothetical protein